VVNVGEDLTFLRHWMTRYGECTSLYQRISEVPSAFSIIMAQSLLVAINISFLLSAYCTTSVIFETPFML